MPETLAIVAPDDDDCAALNALILRSKAHWGYDDAFMEAVREDLAVTPADLRRDACAMVVKGDAVAGVVQVSTDGEKACLERLFIDPAAIGTGAGRALFDWAAERARDAGCRQMDIDSDPQAAGFYERMGARHAGSVPSGSIPGRALPFYVLDL